MDFSSKKKFKAQFSLATIFFDQEEILLIKFKPKRTTIIGVSYNVKLRDLHKAIDEKWKGKAKRDKTHLMAKPPKLRKLP